MKFQNILFLCCLLPVIANAQQPDPNFIDKIAKDESRALIQKSLFIENPDYKSTDLVYQRMEWEVNPKIRFIKGKITSYFKSNKTGLKQIDFDLHSSMTVDSIKQRKQKVIFTHQNNIITIELNNKLSLSQLDSVSIFYQGEPTNTGFGAFVADKHNEVPILWTLSEPYGAREWWPCKQSLSDKIDSIDVIVSTPEQFRTASNGKLISETVNNGTRKMVWKHRHPIATYLVAIAVTNYVDYSEFLNLTDGRKIEVLNYVYPENEANAKSNTKVTTDFINLYNNLIGEYPFANEKYGHAQFGWGGGMEHQTMSFMFDFNFELIAHELAHQWFGDYITTGSWHDIWLNEGFATYLTGLTYENLLDGVWWPRWKKLNVERIVSQPGGAVFVSDTSSISKIFNGRLSYSKGAYLLHMLRWIVGDETFFKALQNYFTDPGIANGFARTIQLQKHFEQAADTSLTEFFDDWFYGEGFPVYSAQFAQIKSGKTKIVLSQSPSHNSVDFFEMPVPVRLYNFGHTDSADFRLMNTQNNQEFMVEPGFEVSELTIDPDYWLISKTSEVVQVPWILNTNETLIYPNPFQNKISVFIAGSGTIVETSLYDLNGKLIKKIQGNQTNFNWPGLPNGTYILQLTTTEKTIEKKLVKQ